MRRTVRDPQGTRWTVGRRWSEGFELPRWRGRDPGLDGFDAAGSLADAGPLAILGAILALIAIALLIVFVAVPLLLFGAELVIVLVVVLAGLAGRLVLGHPWLVQARTGGRVVEQRRIAGWGASLAAVAELREAVAAGRLRVPPAPAPGEAPTTEVQPDAAPPAAPDGPPDAGVGERELGLRAAIAVLLGLLWLGGIGSAVALVLAGGVLTDSDRRAARVGAWIAVVLGFLGVALTIAVAIGLAGQDVRLD
ncbi:hypothetical protein [Conexibacter sp. W3-3-2]|uniref:hypothetical protein n=1 Tax=Conexibacter sp. W3-3-2 TaxID=2675227 RepID=UPI0018A9D035|nr:hypothetical protein [Conexibacter sp. W3-3-2]